MLVIAALMQSPDFDLVRLALFIVAAGVAATCKIQLPGMSGTVSTSFVVSCLQHPNCRGPRQWW